MIMAAAAIIARPRRNERQRRRARWSERLEPPSRLSVSPSARELASRDLAGATRSNSEGEPPTASRLATMSRACTGERPASMRSRKEQALTPSTESKPALRSFSWQWSSPTERRKERSVGPALLSEPPAVGLVRVEERLERMSFACTGLMLQSRSSSYAAVERALRLRKNPFCVRVGARCSSPRPFRNSSTSCSPESELVISVALN
mmetsp:Transcript_35624/g.76062  ORF Transcript_35624/g.76062 Transcript_35624/m.76062 type:complete len:206 (+) Transcript_35624:242-859(+)